MNYDKVRSWPFEPVEQTYDTRDTALYALGVGLGTDPVDPQQLRYVYERKMLALPSLVTMLCRPGPWFMHPDAGIDWTKFLHSGQAITIHKHVPTAATLTGLTRVTRIVDRGVGKGVLIEHARELIDRATNEAIATVTATGIARADGGCGGPTEAPAAAAAEPQGEPDFTCISPTLPQSALIFRLSGDPNPLHVEPAIAAKGGFPRPILHGLCTFGVACHALLKVACGYDAERLTGMEARFSGVVYPGETIRTRVWVSQDHIDFDCAVVEREVSVLSQGRAMVR